MKGVLHRFQTHEQVLLAAIIVYDYCLSPFQNRTCFIPLSHIKCTVIDVDYNIWLIKPDYKTDKTEQKHFI